MRFRPTDDQRLLAQTVREMLEKECPPDAARAGFSRSRWDRLVEMGMVSALASGMSEVDLVPILEEAGRVALPEPLIEAAMIAGGALEGVVTAGVGTPYVAHADVADVIVLEHAGALYAVPRSAVSLEPRTSIDQSRPVFAVSWEASARDRLDADPDVARMRAVLGASAQLLGIAARCIEMAAEYAKERIQFGRPIGSFQAVKHKLADALLRLEFARPVVFRAADSLARDTETKERDVSMGKAFAADAATLAAKAALQTLGAIGYTQEHVLHVWMKRTWALSSSWGNADIHRARVASILLD
ncbi:MAG: acyl-CoA dehydrogenase family protein [Actinomycetota bacterium]